MSAMVDLWFLRQALRVKSFLREIMRSEGKPEKSVFVTMTSMSRQSAKPGNFSYIGVRGTEEPGRGQDLVVWTLKLKLKLKFRNVTQVQLQLEVEVQYYEDGHHRVRQVRFDKTARILGSKLESKGEIASRIKTHSNGSKTMQFRIQSGFTRVDSSFAPVTSASFVKLDLADTMATL